ncbi:hypothetical protein V5O48_008114 [Marasmius crinis-equi]|uniref:RING-type domain-containing protein n=1 Tax=Marasmius crinis-equi TaxID=585013 RepID=A0ABR3FEV1_9AGAR
MTIAKLRYKLKLQAVSFLQVALFESIGLPMALEPTLGEAPDAISPPEAPAEELIPRPVAPGKGLTFYASLQKEMQLRNNAEDRIIYRNLRRNMRSTISAAPIDWALQWRDIPEDDIKRLIDDVKAQLLWGFYQDPNFSSTAQLERQHPLLKRYVDQWATKMIVKEEAHTLRSKEIYHRKRRSQVIDRFSKCPVCDDHMHWPTLMSDCGHTLCAACVYNRFHDQDLKGCNFSCPLCTEGVTATPVLDRSLQLAIGVFIKRDRHALPYGKLRGDFPNIGTRPSQPECGEECCGPVID